MKILDEILKETKFQKPPKLSKFTISLYNKDDYNKLMGLYNGIFPGYMDKNLWNWKNYQNPFGKFTTILMKDKEKIIGAYSVAPKIFFINGIRTKCVQSMDTMTDKKYQGLGISTYLANLTYEYIKRKGYNFVYGFPNETSRYLFLVKLEWNVVKKSIYFIKTFKKSDLFTLTKEINYKFNNSLFQIKEIKNFDNKANELWSRNKKSYPIIINKNKDYLNWRFVDQPYIKYQKYYIFDDTQNLISYFVLKNYKKKNNELIGHIVDFLIDIRVESLREIIFQMIENFSVQKFMKESKMISFWMPDISLQKYITENLDYKIVNYLPYFGYKKFKKGKELRILDSLKNWYITMSNGDVF